jgi:hypothetical protein
MRRSGDASLVNSRAKLARAEEHLCQLIAEAKTFVKSDPYRVINEERGADLDVAVIRIQEYPPLRLGLIFGDVLANWRSALDNLANELVRLNGLDPGSRTSFPIFSRRADFESRGGKRIRGVSETHRAIIGKLQPFQTDLDPTVHALKILNEYVNIDKHRAIHPALTAVVDAHGYAASFRSEALDSEFHFEIDPVGFDRELVDGLDLAHIRWRHPVPNPKPRMSAEFSVRLAFGEKGLLLDALPRIAWHLNLVVECFAPDFGEPISLRPLPAAVPWA